MLLTILFSFFGLSWIEGKWLMHLVCVCVDTVWLEFLFGNSTTILAPMRKHFKTLLASWSTSPWTDTIYPARSRTSAWITTGTSGWECTRGCITIQLATAWERDHNWPYHLSYPIRPCSKYVGEDSWDCESVEAPSPSLESGNTSSEPHSKFSHIGQRGNIRIKQFHLFGKKRKCPANMMTITRGTQRK